MSERTPETRRVEWSASCIGTAVRVGLAFPIDCPLYGRECTPEQPIGTGMESEQGLCRIWIGYGARPDLRSLG